MDVIGSDVQYTDVKLKAWNEMKLDDPDALVTSFHSELDGLDLS